jgi:hypothetical protein
MTVRSSLLLAFALGVAWSADRRWAVRLTAILLAADAIVGQTTASFFPVPQRGATGSSTMHVIGTALESLAIILSMGFAAAAFGKRFRLYSIGTIVILLAFGAAAGSGISRIDAQLPTPWLGIIERINIYAYLLWMAVLAIVILRRSGRAAAMTLAQGVGAAQAVPVRTMRNSPSLD